MTRSAAEPRAGGPRAAGQAGTRGLALVLLAAVVFIGARFAALAGDPVTHLLEGDFNDSIIRYLSVRDWLDGQGWFDMSNARILPPEGLSLHWSRYLDLGIGGVMAGLGLFVPAERAAALALLVWPALLMLAFLALTTRATFRLFGAPAAAAAALGVVFWQVTWNYFGPTQLDHHGLQILLLGVVVLSLPGPGETGLRRGLLGGAAGALSLAIGLETLLPIAAAGLILALRTALAPQHAAQLRAFGMGLATLATLLHLGQTAPPEWTRAQCDELGPAFLGVTALAALAATLIAAAAPRRAGIPARLALTAAIGLAAGGGAFLLLQSCPGFPYGTLPPDLQAMIAREIAEARPALHYVRTLSDAAFAHLPPAYGTTLAATALFAVRWRAGRLSGPEREAVPILLVFAWLGCLAALVQIRLIVFAAPVVPILLGYVLGRLLAARAAMANRTAGSLAVLTVAVTCLMPAQVYMASRIGAGLWDRAEAASEVSPPQDASHDASGDTSRDPSGPDRFRASRACRDAEILRSLASLPHGRVLSDLPLSTPILLVSDHALVSAPYHRSAEALRNGTLALSGDMDALLTALETSRVDYLVLCRDAIYGSRGGPVTDLARGGTHPNLIEVPDVHPDLVVLTYQAGPAP